MLFPGGPLRRRGEPPALALRATAGSGGGRLAETPRTLPGAFTGPSHLAATMDSERKRVHRKEEYGATSNGDRCNPAGDPGGRPDRRRRVPRGRVPRAGPGGSRERGGSGGRSRVLRRVGVLPRVPAVPPVPVRVHLPDARPLLAPALGWPRRPLRRAQGLGGSERGVR